MNKTAMHSFRFITPVFKVREIIRPTKAPFYKDIRIGDELIMELSLQRASGTSVERVTVKNLTQGTEFLDTQGIMHDRMGSFGLDNVAYEHVW